MAIAETDLPSEWVASSETLTEAEDFEAVLPGVSFSFSRTDGHAGVTRFANAVSPVVSAHAIDIGFAMEGAGEVHADTVAVALPLVAAPTPTVWQGVEASVDEAIVYGPGAGHAAAYARDWRLLAVSASWEEVEQGAAALGLDLTDLSGQRLRRSGHHVELLRATITTGSAELDAGREPDEVIRSIIALLATDPGSTRFDRLCSSTLIVQDALNYLESTGSWFPSMIELCRAAAASERRLRDAFIDCFDAPPSIVLRRRALSAANLALRSKPTHEATVTEIAFDHGFRHLPSFAQYHRDAFGALPSQVRPA